MSVFKELKAEAAGFVTSAFSVLYRVWINATRLFIASEDNHLRFLEILQGLLGIHHGVPIQGIADRIRRPSLAQALAPGQRGHIFVGQYLAYLVEDCLQKDKEGSGGVLGLLRDYVIADFLVRMGKSIYCSTAISLITLRTQSTGRSTCLFMGPEIESETKNLCSYFVNCARLSSPRALNDSQDVLVRAVLGIAIRRNFCYDGFQKCTAFTSIGYVPRCCSG